MNSRKKGVPKIFGPTLLMIAQYTTIIVSPLVNLLVVRYLGVNTFGYYASAVAITSLFVLMADFGLQQGILHLHAKGPSPGLIKKGLVLGLLYTSFAYLVTVIWFYSFGYSSIVKWIGLLLAISYFRTIIVSILSAGLQVKGKYSKIALWNLAISTSQWLTTLLVILIDGGLYPLILLPLIIGLMISLLMLIMEGKGLQIFSRDKSKDSMKDLARNSIGFGLTGSMYQIYHRSDSAILSAVRNPVEVGQYTVAFKIMELFFQFPGILFNQILYPKYFSWSKNDPNRLQFYYGMMNKIVFSLGVMASLFVLYFGNNLINVIFGENQVDASSFLFLMSFSIPLFFITSSMGALLTTGGYIKDKIKIQAVVAVLNVLLNVLFVPLYGAIAAALLLVITNVFLIIGYGAYILSRVYKGAAMNKKGLSLMGIQSAILCAPLFTSMESPILYKTLFFLITFSLVGILGFSGLEQDEKNELFGLIKVKKGVVR